MRRPFWVALALVIIGCATSSLAPKPNYPTLFVQLRHHAQAAVYVDNRRVGTVYKNRPCITLRGVSHTSNQIVVRAIPDYTVITEHIALNSRAGWSIRIDGVLPVFDAISIQPAPRCSP